MSLEIWKIIKRAPDYEVSSLGRVRRSKPGPNTHTGKIIAQKREANGYMRVAICVGGVQTQFSVHRLLCEAFHGPSPLPKMDAAHRNGVKHDNRPENVRWSTSKENQNEKRDHGTMAVGERIGSAKLKVADAIEIRRLYANGMSTPKIAPLFGVSKSNIVQIVRRKTWSHLS